MDAQLTNVAEEAETGLAAEKEEVSFADKLYREITSVIGGANANQFFCMGLPGTLIDATQYKYDVDKNQPKPPHVRANESKLVNKLFDACTMTASDNGRHLTSQYKTALNVLTPKLNGKLFEAKNKLRDVLAMPYNYNFGEGEITGLTLEQVFYRLYGEYVETKRAWASKQLEKKRQLEQDYAGDTAEDYAKREDKYLEWYAVTAEAEELAVEEKMGRVLAVFSPGDIEIINAILDSGAGREIQEARAALDQVAEMNPDGGYVYPVTLYPENWFTLLDTSFSAIDLLESPAALSEQLSVLVAERANITANLNSFLAVVPDEAEVAELKKIAEECDAQFKTALQALQSAQITGTTDLLKTLTDVMSAEHAEKPSDVSEGTIARIFGVDAGDVKKIVTALGDTMTACLEKQNALVAAADKAATAAMNYFEKKNKLQLKTMLEPLKQQLENTNEQIAAVKEKINLSATMQKSAQDNEDDAKAVAPNVVPQNFTQVIITSSMKEANQASSSSTSSSSSSHGVSFFFGGYSSSSSHQSAVSEAFAKSSEMKIQIGMSVAKVQIGREWFNPGVFMLTSDMYNTSSTPIAPKKSYDNFTADRFREMNASIFPAFPVSFVIARDVTIKFSSAEAMSSSFSKSVEDHASHGGGFFIFGGRSSSASSSSASNAHAKSTANSVTVRFTNPQILGYYLEATPVDRSCAIGADKTESDKDFITVFEFINAFQSMLQEKHRKVI